MDPAKALQKLRRSREETMQLFTRRAAIAAIGLTGATGSLRAETLEDVYKSKQLSLLVFTSAGSTYDLYARLLARHLGNHLPGKPTVVVQYMVGAGGLKLVDYLNRIAPRDGSVIGCIGRGLAFEPMLGKNEVNFDPRKFNWLGSMNREITIALSWHTSKVKTFDDLRKMELMVPGTGAGADSEIMPRAFNSLAGTKFKIISGYRETTEASLQLETGELEGIAYWSWSSITAAHPDWLRDKKVNILFQTGTKELPDTPGVPSILKLVTDATDRRALEFLLAREPLGRPFLAPPDLPADRVRVLRAAFAATMQDPEFLKDAERSKIEVGLVSGEEVDAILKNAAEAPPAVIDRVKKALDRT
jgi:tripartite-type tricarboxylate transporter receptor subunit TctC